MPDNSERKRLKKKMLDRWENEGGRITADPVIANESNPASQRKGKNTCYSNVPRKMRIAALK